jgi:hypothetical protein
MLKSGMILGNLFSLAYKNSGKKEMFMQQKTGPISAQTPPSSESGQVERYISEIAGSSQSFRRLVDSVVVVEVPQDELDRDEIHRRNGI